MDLDFIEESHRQDILKLMEVCGIDMMEAYQLYENANHSFQAAVDMQLGKGPEESPLEPHSLEQKVEANVPGRKQYQVQDFDEEYEKYKLFKESGLTFENKFQVRKEEGFLSGFIPKFLKKAYDSNFKKNVEGLMGRTCRIQYLTNSLSENVHQYGWKQKFPFILQVLELSTGSKQKLIEILKDDQIIDYCNIQFKTYGLESNSDELQSDFKPYFNLKNDKNTFIIFRVNVCDEIEIIDRINVMALPLPEIIKKIKYAKNICINKQIEDVHLERRYAQELMGIFDYKKPVSIAEKRKIAEDRALRKKQEQEFYASMKAEERKNVKEEESQSESKSKSESSQQSQQSQQSKQTQQSKEKAPKKAEVNWEARRMEVRSKLKMYETGMTIKLRVPSGESLLVNAPFEEKVSYLYDLVFSWEKELGFESEERNFDIMRPYDQLNLCEHKESRLGEVFEGSEMESLIVRER